MSLYKGTNLIAGNPNSANPDLSNITNVACDAIAGNATISPEHDTLSIGASGSTYVSPAHGYFWLHGGSNADAYARLTNNTTSMWFQDQMYNGYGNLSILLPVYEGESVTLNYGGTTSLGMEFYYAVGSEWKQA